ncbi:MAG: hypothetical protein AB2L20_29355 [Mangrovibacterium sp.]
MNFRITVFALAVLTSFVIQSCYTPANIVKLKPSKEADKWFYGQALVHDSIYGVDYEIGFDKFNNDRYFFDFHISNKSNMPILIDPLQFYYIPYNAQMEPIIPEKVTAKDPEEEIFMIEKHLSRNEARRRNQLGISLAAIGADIATTVIVASDDHYTNDYIQRAVADGVHAGVAASGMTNEEETIDLNSLRETWESSAIRKTTLDSNYAMHGKVIFPASPDASYIEINVPVDDRWLKFTFTQIKLPAAE